jgi:hypothetical protein
MRIAMIFARSTAAAVLFWVASIAVIEGGGSGCAPFPFPPEAFARQLLGENEVPPHSTTGYGYGSYKLSEDGTQLSFVITASELSGPVTAAHFHNAQASIAGPVVLDLAPFLTEVDGQVAVAGFSSLADWSIENVTEEVRAGRIYVNLHTAAYPDGEIRGLVILSE